MPPTSRYIWMNGKMVRYEDATIHFMTPALHYGICVFEGIRCYSTPAGPAIFRLKEHMRRLCDSALVLGFRDLPFTAEQLIEAAKAVVAANGFHECYIRPLIYLAEGGWNLTLDTGVPHCAIAVWKWEAYLGEDALERGVRANISSFTRHHSNVMMTKAKISGITPTRCSPGRSRCASGLKRPSCSIRKATSPNVPEKIFSWCVEARSTRRLRPPYWKALRAIA